MSTFEISRQFNTDSLLIDTSANQKNSFFTHVKIIDSARLHEQQIWPS